METREAAQVPMGGLPEAGWRVALAVGILLVLVGGWATASHLRRTVDPERVPVGRLHDLREGEPVFREIDVSFVDPFGVKGTQTPPVERARATLWIVLHPDRGLLALFGRDPHLGCRVGLLEDMPDPDGFLDGSLLLPSERREDVVFANPCHGELYDLAGRAVSRGPQPRGLDRFGSSIEDGEVFVDLTDMRQGPAPDRG